MKQKINLRLIGIAVIAVLATAIGITFIYYGLFKKQVQAGLRTNAEVLMETGVFEKSSQYADVKLPINNLRITWIDSDGAVAPFSSLKAVSTVCHSSIVVGISKPSSSSQSCRMNSPSVTRSSSLPRMNGNA